MIKATELRIGDYTDKGCVTALPMGRQHSEWNIECDYHDYDFEEINPIPLTEEWLIRFGCKPNEKDIPDNYWNKELDFSVDVETHLLKNNIEKLFSYVIYDGDGIHFTNSIQYVHQLQNLYFALTGEELKLKEA